MADRSVIVSALRTPFGKLGGGLARYEATQLGGLAIKSALERIGLEPHEPDYVIMGQVLQAGAGQAPARQAAIAAGLPKETPSDTINKVCASSIRAIEIADAMIRAGDVDVVVTGGMESMSNAPYLLKKARFGYRLGHGELIDSMVYDGLTSTFDQLHMVVQNSQVARELGISRETQDAWAARSHERAAAAQDAGRFDDEIIAVGDVAADEGVRRDTTVEKLAALAPVFDPEGTTTAGNAPGVNDGASCVIVCSETWASAARPRAAGDDPVAGVCGRRLRLSRPHTGERRRNGARSSRQDDRRRPARRDQRGVRLGRIELDEAAGRRRSDRQCERRCDRARPPDRRFRRPHRLDDGARTAPLRRRPRTRCDLLRWRSGRRAADRGVDVVRLVVRAAGGIVVRDGSVLLVHRPRYDDWSFPKGKLEGDESWEEGAIREVEEETGLRCEVGPLAGSTRYFVAQGPKEVRYFRMTSDGEAVAQNEVDEVRWALIEEARALLTHERDRKLLEKVSDTGTVSDTS